MPISLYSPCVTLQVFLCVFTFLFYLCRRRDSYVTDAWKLRVVGGDRWRTQRLDTSHQTVSVLCLWWRYIFMYIFICPYVVQWLWQQVAVTWLCSRVHCVHLYIVFNLFFFLFLLSFLFFAFKFFILIISIGILAIKVQVILEQSVQYIGTHKSRMYVEICVDTDKVLSTVCISLLWLSCWCLCFFHEK